MTPGLLNLWSIFLALCVSLALVLLTKAAVINPGDFRYAPDTFVEDKRAYQMHEVKRAGYRPVPFPCNGYDNLPRCMHRGKGPRKTLTKSGRFCVCLCPTNWIGPECGYSANSLPGRRSFPWSWQPREEQKRSYAWDSIGQEVSDS